MADDDAATLAHPVQMHADPAGGAWAALSVTGQYAQSSEVSLAPVHVLPPCACRIKRALTRASVIQLRAWLIGESMHESVMANFSRLKVLAKDLLPPVVTRAILKHRQGQSDAQHAASAMVRFYETLIAPGTLCFDIGANVGNRVAALRRLDLPVVALEPQPQCYARLQTAFGNDPGVTLVMKAVGSAVGAAKMQVADVDTVSSMSQTFIDVTTHSGRFGQVAWTDAITVEVTTLDELISRFGLPGFIKIDVEGYELEVIRGLSQPIALISLEYTPELTDVLLACLAHITQLGPVECNLSWMESMKLCRSRWMDVESLRTVLGLFREETFLFGDVYVRALRAA